MAEITLPIGSWNRFVTRNLLIDPILIGASHEFTYEKSRVKIQLPSRKYLPTEPLEGELLSFYVYKEVEGKKLPSHLRVHAVDVEIFTGQQVTINDAILNQLPNAYDLVPELRQNQFATIAEAHNSLAESAYNLWIRVLRWKSDDSAIGRPEVVGHKSGWGTYLIAESTHGRIWNFSQPDTLEIGETVITPETWNDADSDLKSGMNPPIFVELMFDAVQHIKLGDFQRATVDMAVACESYLRMLVSSSLPSDLSNSVREYLDEANIRPVLTRMVPEILSDQERQQLKRIQSRLHKLFDIRNDIVHMGATQGLGSRDCQQFLEATKALIGIRN